ncbi:beta-ketoacyl synthase N-terminal-like domain-containing protein [Streptomyces griseus]|uniref:Beta-ketoacyl synthase N-terminal-like domain-containing protein n=1 Tax=Streptomyces stephensoniae TaxID=3375367 RepID=A0ABU2W7T5_9ACTN|nr:beta-ketoacyl synthase N-terminal-like domain-containing protein [Streptomyces griseus]MDT0493911.1 beta-ketoacyl synthase N-terminal-like domain-containing protein [Streptomyces griseus]
MSNAVITAWSAVSPYGTGSAPLADGLRTRTAAPRSEAPEEWTARPDATARLVPGFDVREALGRAGTRGMDRLTGLTAVTVRELLAARGAEQDDSLGTGVVLGTAAGSVQGFMEFTRASLEGARPIDVPPSKAPNMAMNRAASASAIRHALKGPNSTVAAGRLSGLVALDHARRLLADGRATRVLAGSAEEYSASRAHLTHAAHGDDVVLGEGCVMVLLEPADRADGRPLAELLAVHHRVAPTGDFTAALTAAVETALTAAGVRADEVWAALPGNAPGAAGEQEVRLHEALFGVEVRERVATTALLGETAAATGAFQLAALLSEPGEPGRIALVTTTDPDGYVGCAVLRLLTDGTPPAAGNAPTAGGAPAAGDVPTTGNVSAAPTTAEEIDAR